LLFLDSGFWLLDSAVCKTATPVRAFFYLAVKGWEKEDSEDREGRFF